MPDYTLYPKVKPTGELPPKVLEHLDARFWNHDQELPIGAGGNGTAVDVRRYGVKGDGTTDDTAALQAAMDASVGKAVFIPAGRYVVSDVVRIRAGTTVFGEPGTVITVPNRATTSVFRASGYLSPSRQVELSGAVGTGDRVITTKTAHGYTAGDVVKLQSQRVACSTDAGAWRLGWPTVGSTGPRFAEYGRIESVQSSTQFTLDSGLIFPGYRGDSTQETDSGAGDSTIIMKSDGGGDRVTIRDLEFEGEAREFVRFVSCVEPVAENLRVRVKGSEPSRAVQFLDCYLGQARNIVATCDVPILGTQEHAIRNLIHIAGCHSTGAVNCRIIRGTQCYDVTYDAPKDAEHTSVYCYVQNCESVSAIGNPITVHPGTYGAIVINNRFTECQKSGIAIRSNSALVTGNRIVGSGQGQDIDNPGIYLLEGAGLNSLIADNFVEGFRVGFRVNDGAGKPFTGWIGVTVRGNTFRDFVVGAARTRMTGEAAVTDSQGIILDSNSFVTDRVDSVGVLTCEYGRGVSGWTITGNQFSLPSSGSVGVQITGPSGDMVATGNVFHSVGQPVARSTTGVSSDSPVTILHWSSNVLVSTGIDRVPPPTADFQIESRDNDPMRLPDAAYSLNYALWSGRFYAAASTASAGRGWPFEGFEGYVEVVRLSSSLVTQTGHGMDGRRHTRTWSAAGGWTNWKVA